MIRFLLLEDSESVNQRVAIIDGLGYNIDQNGRYALLTIDIPGYKHFFFQYLVLDYNGTIALDGTLLSGVKEGLTALSQHLEIFVLTADTFGQARTRLADVPCQVTVIGSSMKTDDQTLEKEKFVKNLNPSRTIAIGNGRNDRLMLQTASLGICVMQDEGAAMETMTTADIVCPNILRALELLLNPLRLIATLRS